MIFPELLIVGAIVFLVSLRSYALLVGFGLANIWLFCRIMDRPIKTPRTVGLLWTNTAILISNIPISLFVSRSPWMGAIPFGIALAVLIRAERLSRTPIGPPVDKEAFFQ